MKEFKQVNKTFIKSNNKVSKIYNRYLYSLIPFILLILIYNLTYGSLGIILSLIKSLSISLLVSIITQYIFNIIHQEKDIKKLFKEDKIITISLILGLFSIHSSIPIIIISSLISIIIKNISKTKTIYSSLYGLLFILIFTNTDNPLSNLNKLSYIDSFNNIVKTYGSITNYIFGFNNYYLSPILSILVFIYLFYKKSIKYNIVFSYISTISFIMLFFGILNNMNIWYVIFQLTTGNILFLSVYLLPNYIDTPITEEGQIIYGIILGIITSILRFITPVLSVVITLIIGPLLITKFINKISINLKYNKKYYYTVVSLSIILIILTTVILNIVI